MVINPGAGQDEIFYMSSSTVKIVVALISAMTLYSIFCCFRDTDNDETSPRSVNGPRYTVIVSSTYDGPNGKVTDTQRLQFGSQEAAEQYARQYIGQPNIHVEIQGPPMRST